MALLRICKGPEKRRAYSSEHAGEKKMSGNTA